MFIAAAAAKPLPSCLTLCDPIDGSPPGFPIPGILQERTLEWVAISLSNVWKWKVKGKSLSRVQLFATPWTAVHQPGQRIKKQRHYLVIKVLSSQGHGFSSSLDQLSSLRSWTHWKPPNAVSSSPCLRVWISSQIIITFSRDSVRVLPPYPLGTVLPSH